MVERDGVLAAVVPATPDRSVVNSVAYEDAGRLERALPELAEVYEAAGVRAWTVWVPHDDAEAAGALAGAGHVLDAEPAAMAMELSALEAPRPADLDLDPEAGAGDRRADQRPRLHLRRRPLRAVPAHRSVAALLRRAGRRAPGVLRDRHDHDGDTGAPFVATLPEARGRGLAGRLLAHRAARGARARLHHDQPAGDEDGLLVYARLGYRDLGAVQMWERRAAAVASADCSHPDRCADDAHRQRRQRSKDCRSSPATSPTTSGSHARRSRAGAYGYFAGGAGDERTLRENVEAYGRWQLRPRALVDVSEATTATTVLGAEVSMPLLVAPVAFQRMAHPDGEAGMARAAAAAGTIMVLSTLATATPAEVAAAAPGAPRWFQLYCFRDRGVTRALIDQAEEAGFEAIALTVDAPRLGRRERDLRTGFVIPADVTVPSFAAAAGKATAGTPADMFSLMDPSSAGTTSRSWPPDSQPAGAREGHRDRARTRRWPASTAPPAWSSPTTAAASSTARPPRSTRCPEVVDAVEGRIEVLVDGGIRRGADVVKALALGARAVLAGPRAAVGARRARRAGRARGARAAARGDRAGPGAGRLPRRPTASLAVTCAPRLVRLRAARSR